MKVCIVIPNYNHANIKSLLIRLELYHLPCIIVDDGSITQIKQELADCVRQFFWVRLVTLPYNQGKGAAVLAGLTYANELGYTHAIQIDADQQHDPFDIPKFLSAITANPEALIVGQPLYDGTIPKSRSYGRKVTNFWVGLETFSGKVKDAMCGYRAYPLEKTLQIAQSCVLSKRMGFDIEIIVRLCWDQIKVISIPTKVTYPENGVSHFRIWQDNLEIFWVHTRLFWGMLQRLLQSLFREMSPLKHWSKISEKGSFLGMYLVFYSYKILGKRLTYFLLYPITTYFYCFSPLARQASKKYFAKLGCQQKTYRHFLTFSEAILDKLIAWHGGIDYRQIEFPNIDLLLNNAKKGRGGIILTAHLGNIEVARAISYFYPEVKFTAILFVKNAKKINQLLRIINPNFGLNLICLESLDVVHAMDLQTKVDNGEFVVVAGDRTSVTKPKNSLSAKFLGDSAYFPKGPFILAGLLKCPVYFMLCLKQDQFNVIFQELVSSIDISKEGRDQRLQHYIQQYALLLEKYCRQYPLQWFNFFDFWQSYDK